MATARMEVPTPDSVLVPYHFDEASHTFTNGITGRKILSVTQVLDTVGIVDYSDAPQEAMSRKSKLGSAVHRASEYIDAPKSELDWDSVDERIVPYVLGWEEFCADTHFVPEAVELSGCVKLPQGEVGFIIDRIGLLEGQLSAIIEIKCTCQEEESWKIQLAGYEACALALGYKPQGAPTFKRAAVQLLPERVNGKYYKAHPYDNRMDRRAWECALFLATWKQLHGYKLGEERRPDYGTPHLANDCR